MLVIRNIYVFYLYFYLLVFSIINRSFTPLGIDIRYLIIPLGIVSLFMLFIKREISIKYPCNNICLAVIMLYLFVIQSFWNIHVQIVEYEVYENVIVLNVYNLFNIIILSLYYRELSLDLFYKAMRIALLFLGVSILITLAGVDLPYNSYKAISVKGEVSGMTRYCGYGTDPNYVSMFFVSFIFIAYDCLKKDKKSIVPIGAVCLFFLLLSRSTTVISVMVLCLFIRFLYKKIGNNRKLFVFSVLISLLCLVFVFLQLKVGEESVSLAIRYKLWDRALDHFLERPWLGNGITSIRNFAFLSESGWFVQVHSTFFQMLSEQGFISLGLYFYIFYKILYEYIGMATFYAILIYFIWSFTYETMYLGFPIIYFAILPYCTKKYKKEGLT